MGLVTIVGETNAPKKDVRDCARVSVCICVSVMWDGTVMERRTEKREEIEDKFFSNIVTFLLWIQMRRETRQ